MSDRRPAWLAAVLWVGAFLLVVAAVGPALWLLLAALQPAGSDMYSFNQRPTLRNFEAAWNDGRLGIPLVNSVLVTLARAGLNVVLAAAAAYPLARMSFRGRDTVFVLLLCTMMIPDQVILVPMFRIVVGLSMYDTLAAVVVPFGVSAMGIFMCRQAFMAIPASLEEAARVDGAGSLRTWWHVMLPLAAPTLSTLAIFSVIGAWSELLWPLVVLQSPEKLTLPVALTALMGQFSTNIRAAYAGAVLALVPIVAAFVALQKFFRPEMFGGAVKG